MGVILKAKEFLLQVKIKNARVEAKIREKAQFREMMCAVSSPGLDERVQSSPSPDKLTNIIAKLQKYEADIDKAVDEYCDFRIKVSNMISQLTDARYIEVLHRRHICFEEWEQIADAMGYTVRYIQQLHGQALIEFDRVHHDELYGLLT